MRLILLGPPGSGKGTQAQRLCRQCRLEHIGTGDLLREAIARKTPAGIQAHPYVADGRLVPDEVVNNLIAERFNREDRPARFVMDGYPRTVAQARAFAQVLQTHELPLSAVILLEVPDEEIVKRLSGRWSCPRSGCKATYHTIENPPKVAGICDQCGTALVQREDDKEETVRRRQVVYHKNTEELIPYFEAQRLLLRVDGVGTIDQVQARVTRTLKQAGVWC
jgi:adenylate kinase